MAVDFSGVTAAWDRTPPNYTAGETMRITIAGVAVNTTDPTTVQETWGPFTIPITATAAAAAVSVPDIPDPTATAVVTSTITVSAVVITRTIPGQSTNEQVFIDAPANSTLVLGGRNFTVSADRKSISAVA